MWFKWKTRAFSDVVMRNKKDKMEKRITCHCWFLVEPAQSCSKQVTWNKKNTYDRQLCFDFKTWFECHKKWWSAIAKKKIIKFCVLSEFLGSFQNRKLLRTTLNLSIYNYSRERIKQIIINFYSYLHRVVSSSIVSRHFYSYFWHQIYLTLSIKAT